MLFFSPFQCFQTVLASMPDLQCGFSRDLFIQWCSNPRNTVILTNRTSPGTLARYLIDTQGVKSMETMVRIFISMEDRA